MKVTVLNGTQFQGITYHLKEYFLNNLKPTDEIVEFYPNDFPSFCLGCKNCFFKGEQFCPHIDKVAPIWEAMLSSELIVVAYPIYALRAPGSLKTLYDHLCRHWLVHRPEEKMFYKKLVILTNSVGTAFQQKSAIKDTETSFSWLGVGRIYYACAGMMGEINWSELSNKRNKMLQSKAIKVFKRAKVYKPILHKSMRIKVKFSATKFLHKAILKNEDTPSLDNQHYITKGWIKHKKRSERK